MEAIRLLLKSAKDVEKWADHLGQEQRLSFENRRTKIAEVMKSGIKSFTPGITTALKTDWSRTGISFHLTQKHCKFDAKVPV